MICDSLVNLKPHFFRLCKSAASIHESNVFYTSVYMSWISHYLLVLLVFFVLRLFYFQCLVD